jgi:rubrerythrin
MKMQGFSGTEIVEVAVQMEKNGNRFYSVFAKRLKDKKAKGLFSYMAEEELRHMRNFKDILSSVQDYQPKESYPQEYFSYLNAVAGDYIFLKNKKMEEKIKKIIAEIDAVDFSLGIEKDSVLFYEEIKNTILANDRGIIDKIIEQEKNHIIKLWDLRNRIK